MNRVVCFAVWVAFNHALRGPPKDMQSKVKIFQNVAMTSSIVDGGHIFYFLITMHHSYCRQENNRQMDALCL